MPRQTPVKSWAQKLFSSGALRWGAGVAGALLLGLSSAAFFLDEPLRATIEKSMNRDLKGYAVSLQGVHVQLIGLSLTLKGLTVVQQAHPDPPIVTFPVLKASIQWRSILLGKLVAEFLLDRPKVNINLQQLESEAASSVTLKERGWQKAVEDIYPLKINAVKVTDASVTYIDHDPKRPLVLSHLNLQGTNIRNVYLPDKVYPSTFHLDTAIFGTGHGSIDGAANLLAEPYPGIKGQVRLTNVPLHYFTPIFARRNLAIHGGVLRASGEAEYTPKVKIAHLENLDIKGMTIDYIHSPASVREDEKRLALLARTAREVGNRPGMSMRADQVSLTDCTIGMVNETPGKRYRLFLSHTDLRLNNFSNHFSSGPAQARLSAKFMGSGVTTASANFRPEQAGADLDLHVTVVDSQLTALNEVLRAYGNFDVAAGSFSLVSELRVKHGTLSGYVKPFFKDMKVYDRRKDKGRGALHQMYEVLVGGVAAVLENRSRQEVATRATIRGSLADPQTSTWQVVSQLVKNAFFKAIVPGFEAGGSGSGER